MSLNLFGAQPLLPLADQFEHNLARWCAGEPLANVMTGDY